MQTTALIKAIAAAGGQSALARGISKSTGRTIRQGHIWSWLYRTQIVPAEYVIAIESITGVSRHDLRPDIYPHEVRKRAREQA
jgi:DNA-binding transcriptional regulator YdaS (Cro superfamily)